MQLNCTLTAIMSNYPVVILPDSLARISSALPPLPPIPQEPPVPTLKEPKEPVKPAEPASFAQAWGCGLLAIGIFILAFYGVAESELVGELLKGLGPFILLLLLAPFLGIYVIYSYHKNSDKEQMEYAEKMNKYMQDMDKYNHDKVNYKSQFERELDIYTLIVNPNYLKVKQQYEQDKQRILSSQHVSEYRQQLVIDFFHTTKQPVKINNLYLTGVSEEPFYNFLRSKSNCFLKGYSFIEGTETEKYYVPDIIYYDNQTGILIDIEIDEPYLGSDGTPIHFIGYDNRRNEFFKINGWIVIRFAEEQVVKYPQQCYTFMDNFIRKIKAAQFDLDYDCIQTIPHWTKDEAHKIAFVRTRNKYLNRNLIEKMPEEILVEKRNGNEQTFEKRNKNVQKINWYDEWER